MQTFERLGFGCVGLTAMPTASSVNWLLNGVFDLGVTHFDTAPAYGQGYSEKLVGDFLRGKRGQVSVATKFGLPPSRPPSLPNAVAVPLNALRRRMKPNGQAGAIGDLEQAEVEPMPEKQLSRSEIEAQFEASLRSLRTDYIDLYLFHEGIPRQLSPEAWDYLKSLRASGQVRQLGLAANGSHYLPLSAADVAGWDVLQYESGPAWPRHEALLVQFPDLRHVFHSCLKGVQRDDGAVVAEVLKDRLAANPDGRVLFASRNLGHVRNNLNAIGR